MQQKQTSECNYKFLGLPPPAFEQHLGGMRHNDIVVADD
jgi:hypothetical protein